MGNIYGFILKILIKLEQREYRKERKEKFYRLVPAETGYLFIAAVVIAFGFTVAASTDRTDAESIQQGIAKEIIRFHVLANSDSEEDQELKLKVKDAVVNAMDEKVGHVTEKEIAKEILQSELDNIIETAENIICQEGYSYPVKAEITEHYFPAKQYGDMVFPPGEYESLRIEIGEAKGKNWWCVMYPPLCFVDGTYSIVPDESKKQLQGVLTDEEYNSLSGNGKIKVKVKFKLFGK